MLNTCKNGMGFKVFEALEDSECMDKECLMQSIYDSQDVLEILRSPENLDLSLVASLKKNFSRIWNTLESIPQSSSELKQENG